MSSTARRCLTFTALLVVFYGFQSPAEAQVAAGAWLSVRTGPAHIQLEPRPEGGVVAELTQATLVQASQFRDGWYYVRLPKRGSELADRWGWISALSVLPSAPPPPVARTASVAPAQAGETRASLEKAKNGSGRWASIKRALNPVNWFR